MFNEIYVSDWNKKYFSSSPFDLITKIRYYALFNSNIFYMKINSADGSISKVS